MTAPRIFCITAPNAAVAAVIRRGPSKWCHLGRWDYRNLTYEPGQWLSGTIYPQRCELSRDGTYFSYFALAGKAEWPAGSTYIAVSRLPELTAIAAWGTDGTWTRGAHFTGGDSPHLLGAPDVGAVPDFEDGQRLALSNAHSFAVERRRGWAETADTPPRDDDDQWDQYRSVKMFKQSPSDPTLPLVVEGGYAAQRELEPARVGIPHYTLSDDQHVRVLDDVWWADWAPDGGMLVATRTGRLQYREPDAERIRWEHDLSAMSPHD
jgi:hypothetical protein